MRTIARRISELESRMVPRRTPRILHRYEGPGSERFPQPTQEDLDEGWPVLTMRFFSEQRGHPAELTNREEPTR
jgi:hypothetical protein